MLSLEDPTVCSSGSGISVSEELIDISPLFSTVTVSGIVENVGITERDGIALIA